jgi:adenylate cyclase
MTTVQSGILADPGRLRCAILTADISGYTRLMSIAEQETHARCMRLSVNIIQPGVVGYRGRIVKHTGDGFVAWFVSCLDAIKCALDLQKELLLAEAQIPPESRILFRMGLNVGEVLFEQNDIFGHEVNIAARLHDRAEAGTVVISEATRKELGSQFVFDAEDLGPLRLRNIAYPVRAFAMRPNPRMVVVENIPIDHPRRVNPPAVAVLPFRDLNAPGGQSYVADGILEEIAARLANLAELLTISANSTFRYRDPMHDVSRVAQELGVRYVITGTRQQLGMLLRIMVDLNDAETGRLLWSTLYDGEVDHIFDLQDRISMDVVGTIAPQILDRELRRSFTKRPDSMDAYDYFLQGVHLLRGKDLEEFSRGRRMFQRAIELDDSYAPAFAYAAFWHIRNLAQGWSNDHDFDRNRADALSAAAIEREPNNAMGLAVHAHCRSFLFRDYDTAIPLFEHALAQSPNNALVLSFSSLTRSYILDAAKALQQAEKSIRISPFDMYSFWLHFVLSIAHYADHNFCESLVWSKRAMGENRRFSANLRMLAASFSAVGNVAEARQVGTMLMEVDPNFRVSKYAITCPWGPSDVRAEFVSMLRLAGLPE